MRWLKKLGDLGRTLRECLSEVGMARALRRAEVNMDRLPTRSMDEPILRAHLVKDGLNEMPIHLRSADVPIKGSEWIKYIAEEAAAMSPSRPRR